MAKVKQAYVYPSVDKTLSVPIVTTGYHYELQHTRNNDIDGFITSTFYDKLNNITQTGVDFANQNIKVGISLPAGDHSFFLSNSPMIFLELLDSKIKRSKGNRGDKAASQWVHPCSFGGAVNNNSDPNTNRGRNTGGDGQPLNSLITEFKFVNTESFQDQIIEIAQKQFYNDPSVVMPESKVDWSLNPTRRGLRKMSRRGIYSPESNAYVVTSYTQPIRFRFVCIDPTDPSKRNLIYGPPSEEYYISPKGGYFGGNLDHYWYGWQIRSK